MATSVEYQQASNDSGNRSKQFIGQKAIELKASNQEQYMVNYSTERLKLVLLTFTLVTFPKALRTSRTLWLAHLLCLVISLKAHRKW